MITIEEADSWIGRTAVDNTGEQIGVITQIWVDDASGQPEWASVKSAALRGREALVPLAGAAARGGGRQFAYSKEEIVEAPHVAQDGRLGVEDKERIAAYYGTPGTEPMTAPPSAKGTHDITDAPPPTTEAEMAPPPAAPEPAPVAQPGKRRFRRRAGRSEQPTPEVPAELEELLAPHDEAVMQQHDEVPV